MSNLRAAIKTLDYIGSIIILVIMGVLYCRTDTFVFGDFTFLDVFIIFLCLESIYEVHK